MNDLRKIKRQQKRFVSSLQIRSQPQVKEVSVVHNAVKRVRQKKFQKVLYNRNDAVA